jgi:hypothetical protein
MESNTDPLFWGWAQIRDRGHWEWHAVGHVEQVGEKPVRFRFTLACGRKWQGNGVQNQPWPQPGEAKCTSCSIRHRRQPGELGWRLPIGTRSS